MRISGFLLGFLGVSILGLFLYGAEMSVDDLKSTADKLRKEGNFNDAQENYRKVLMNKEATPKQIDESLDSFVECLNRLGRIDEIDLALESCLKTHPDNWQVKVHVAETYQRIPHYGFVVEGEFQRGNRRRSQGAEYVNAFEQDRVRSLQLFQEAMALVKNGTAKEQGEFYLKFAQNVMSSRQNNSQSWQLQAITDLSELPNVNPSNRYFDPTDFGSTHVSGTQGAPVDAEGNPVVYAVPESWETASSDGERWRWLLDQAVKANPALENQVLWTRANFAFGQFGVQTLGGYISLLRGSQDDDEADAAKGKFSVRSLNENETIARLANGVKRFEFPEEYNPIELFKQIVENPKTGYDESALQSLVRIFENRMQYPRAAEFLKTLIEKHGDNDNKSRAKQLSQIVDPWGTFEGTSIEPAGDQVELSFKFRNGELLELEAFALKHELLINDVKAYLKSQPAKWDWNKAQLGDIGHQIVVQNQTRYKGKSVAKWTEKLEPREEHLDRRISLKAPLKDAGAYLLIAKMKDGNTSRIVVWLDDMSIVQKPLDNKQWYYFADTKTGEPIANVTTQFFGYKVESRQNKRPNIVVSEFADRCDANGQLIVGGKLLDHNRNWLLTAKSRDGRVAHLGFDRIWHQGRQWEKYQQNKVYTITDRPVYRPGQAVKFKFWIRQADYQNTDKCKFAGKSFRVEIVNPRGEKVLEKTYTADEYGGFDDELELPDDATLGSYSINIPRDNTSNVGGGNSFRVEEYKKPEYEVTVDAPDEPIQLGEKVTATVKAKYYFGAPVTKGFVKYKVERISHDSRWFPVEPYDWLYGNGYWWFGENYTWYPGWNRWGCLPPTPWWWHNQADPPEVIMENEVPIGPDGTIEIEIDTELAKELHGDTDHNYSITAEVVDESRRTIVGSGSVLVARDPFQVFTWMNRGYYNVGDTATASIKAQTLDKKPIIGPAVIKLYQIRYDEKGQPQETEVEKWETETNAEGMIEQKLKTTQPGQFRLSCTVTDTKGNSREGGIVFVVRGEGSNLADYRFNDLEIVPDKKSYQPGETVKLMINTNQENSTVLLFLRPSNGVYLPPQTIRMQGKSTVVDIGVKSEDMPNFFIEAMTLSDANIYQQLKDVVVPPEKRIINVSVEPSSERYLPGSEAKVDVILTDMDGNPIQGSTVLTVYDRSVEYISGGSNVPEIREFFWKFRRSHNASYRSSLQRYFGNIIEPNELSMQAIGIFGNLVADTELSSFQLGVVEEQRNDSYGMVRSKMSRMNMMADGMAAPMAAPMAGMAMEKSAADKDSSGFRNDGLGGEANFIEPTIRKEFADTAYWAANVTPDENGRATVTFNMPENLTAWKLKAWSMGEGTRVGEGEAAVVTAKDVLVRLQAPRFFVEKDEVIISANVHNYLEEAKSTRVVMMLEGNTLEGMDELTRTITIPAGGEQRVDWRVKATAEGSAVITVKALTDADSDAMQMTFPVYVHGMLKTESFTGVLRNAEGAGKFTVNVPAERRPNETRFEIRYSPTLAGAMIDALPYLLDYPYGCTEQTLNRFVPAVITQKILQDLGVNLEEIQQKVTNLNAQEIGEADERAAQWKRFDANPVYNTDKMKEIVKVGLKRLTDMQLSDGGWGWFSGYGEHAYPHTTATVVHGLQVAEANGMVLVEGMLDRGIKWLEKYQNEQVRLLKKGEAEKPEQPYRKKANNLDALVYMILVDAGIKNQQMQDYLYRDRTDLSVYSLAMFGLTLHKLEVQDRLDMVLKNIEQYFVEDLENETAYLKFPAGYSWWYWHGNEVEANAYYLKLLSRVEPNGVRAPRLVKYLLNNRKHSTYWNSTRDTSLCIEALAEYLQASGEDQPDMDLEVLVDGQVKKQIHIDGKNLLTFDGTVVIEGEALSTGQHTVEFRKVGRGPLYWNAYLTNFTLEDPIAATGLELKVRRSVYKLVPKKNAKANVAGSSGQVVSQKVEEYDRIELQPGDEVVSGDLLEIELGIDSKNDYEYVILEDFKAAGTEPVDIRSGYIDGGNGAYAEFRDEKVAFFIRALQRGTSSMKYRLRAEIPGSFSALPTFSYAMYAPELKANSDEFKITIEERVRE
ncbi:alpha-2-macroglobulin family protein [Rubinisphaera italica]|uniref:MG2 domain protein n=1 Tax=Rubinisphaera italica TaxID=2527969 RepID=A0A5C5XJC2_9PLAN|nr:MG2 domain-containing protein [Rubinisphaera italica]TWT63287.1 MG2 domain protein [Rubinisphaera italica]